jgi:hypothetical protein
MSRGVRRDALVKASERPSKKRPTLLGVNESVAATAIVQQNQIQKVVIVSARHYA